VSVPEPSESPKSPKFKVTVPLIAAIGLGVTAFLPWLETVGVSLSGMELRFDGIWYDLVDFELASVWLGPVLLVLAGAGLVAVVVPAVPAFVYRIVAILAIAVVAMFFRAILAADLFEFIEFGAFGAAGFALFMLAPRT
jgi:hypothetical protein